MYCENPTLIVVYANVRFIKVKRKVRVSIFAFTDCLDASQGKSGDMIG